MIEKKEQNQCIIVASEKEINCTKGSNKLKVGISTTINKRTHQQDAAGWFSFSPKVFQSINPQPQAIAQALEETILTMDKELCENSIKGGTTAAIYVYDGRENIISAIVGDSLNFAVFYDENGDLLGLTCLNSKIHNLDDLEEKKRVLDKGSKIDDHCVKIKGHKIGMTRSIGDRVYKKSGLIATPTIDITSLPQLIKQLNIDPNKIANTQFIGVSDGFTHGAKQQNIAGFKELLTNCLEAIKKPGLLMPMNLSNKLKSIAQNFSKDNIIITAQTTTPTDKPSLMCVCDGHGTVGHEASRWVVKNMGSYFIRQLTHKLKATEVIVPKDEDVKDYYRDSLPGEIFMYLISTIENSLTMDLVRYWNECSFEKKNQIQKECDAFLKLECSQITTYSFFSAVSESKGQEEGLNLNLSS